MKIALLVAQGSPYSENRLVGIKRVVFNLAKYFLNDGHEVSLIAPKDSSSEILNLPIDRTIMSAKSLNISVFDPRSFYYATVHASMAAKQSYKYDIIHNHMDFAFVPFISLIKTPVLSTIHGTKFTPDEETIFKNYYNQIYAVGISNKSIELTASFIKCQWQVYNGIDLNLYPFHDGENNDYMYLMGRMNQDKGPHEGIMVANFVKRKLIVAGFSEVGHEKYYHDILQEAHDASYVEFLKDQIIGDEKKSQLYKNAKLFLFPIKYEETFGMVATEAMASGTPVVAFARGALPEIIQDGVTGLLINPSEDDIRGNWITKKTGIEGLCEAVERIYALSPTEYRTMRQECRAHVEKKFAVKKMGDEYKKIYQEVITKNEYAVNR